MTLDIEGYNPVVMIPSQNWYCVIDNTDFSDLFIVSKNTYTKLWMRNWISKNLDPVEMWSVYYLRDIFDLDVTLDIEGYNPFVMILSRVWYGVIDNTDFSDLYIVSVTSYTKLTIRL